MIDFTQPSLKEYWAAVSDNFPLFRMFLADDIDAILVHFISNKFMSSSDMLKVEKGLLDAIKKLASTYPSKMPRNSADKGKGLKKLNYEGENFNYLVVFNLTQILVHIRALTSAYISTDC